MKSEKNASLITFCDRRFSISSPLLLLMLLVCLFVVKNISEWSGDRDERKKKLVVAIRLFKCVYVGCCGEFELIDISFSFIVIGL